MSFSRSGLSESLVTDTMVAILPPFALAKAAGSRAAPDEIAGADTSCVLANSQNGVGSLLSRAVCGLGSDRLSVVAASPLRGCDRGPRSDRGRNDSSRHDRLTSPRLQNTSNGPLTLQYAWQLIDS